MKTIGIELQNGLDLAKKVEYHLDSSMDGIINIRVHYDSNTGLSINYNDMYIPFETAQNIDIVLRQIGLKIFGIHYTDDETIYFSVVGVDEE